MTSFQRNKKRRERKGVVLLIIVTLLTLLVLIGLALSVVAINFRDSGEKVRAAGTYGDLPDKEMDIALGQFLYGSNQFTASISPHNLLGDLYGHDGVAGVLQIIPPATQAVFEENDGQVLKITYQELPVAQQPFGRTFSPLPHYYSGRVLTFTDGTAAGFSTRVMAYLPTPGSPATGTLYLEAIESDLPVKVLPSSGNRFLINGAPFNGTGFGYYPGNNYNIDMDELGGDATSSGQPPVALVGNFAALPNVIPFVRGGPDEPWDAADLNNWHLSVVPPAIGQAPLPIIPSFHRPELVNYWLYQVNPAGGNINQIPLDRLRKISLRPIGAEYGPTADHPNFTGSNSAFMSNTGLNPSINGPWDVDNDGDGIADSIWVDLGLPAITGKDGRKYKRLFAFLIKDLDGRLNVNVHGNLMQLPPTIHSALSASLGRNVSVGLGDVNYRADQPLSVNLGYATAGQYLTRGSGYGAGEVDFRHVFGGNNEVYGDILTRRYQSPFNLDNFDDQNNDNVVDARPGAPLVRDGFNIVKHHGTPNDYANIPPVQEWASPPDVWGRGALALDTSGNPLTLYMGQTGEMLDNPYEFHVGPRAVTGDSPYTVADMEALLRYHDPSARNLGTRLINATTSSQLASSSPGVLGVDHRRREVFTTRSHLVPVAMTRVPREFYTVDPNKPGSAGAVSYIQNKRNPSLLELYIYKLIRETGLGETDPNVQAALAAIVPFEVRQGQRFNINRFLGDGWDNNGDGVADDYNESGSGAEPAWLAAPQVPQTFQGATAWHTNDTDFNGDGNFNGQDFINARQLFARHLFCLMMALMDDGYLPQMPENPALATPQDIRELSIRRVAQWAINVVDFRDSDGVMSGFEYDANPFNGWQVDGNLGTDGSAGSPEMINGAPVQTNERRLVWGVEFPDLVLTETFAMHDRRTRDTRYDSMTRDIDGGDMHPDQLRLPQGSLFVELYCPRAKYNNNPRLPQELYAQYAPGQWRLNLQKLVPPSFDGVQRPVWRLAISDHTGNNAPASVTQETPWQRLQDPKPFSTSFEPSNMTLLPGPVAQLPIDRYVWFSSVDPPMTATTEYGRTFVNSVGWDVSLEPGQYAVVGPRTATYVGSRTDGDPLTYLDGDSPQGISLSQRTMVNPNGVVVTGLNGMATYTPGTQIKNSVGIVCDMPVPVAPDPNAWLNANRRIGLNVTEPMPLIQGYYYREPTSPNGDDAYDDFVLGPLNTLPDEPIEWPAAAVPYPLAQWNMYSTGTYDNVRAIFVQRLADPNAAWHPQYNPYITVDWASTDVTVFTGEDTPQIPTAMGMDRDSSDTWDPATTPLQFHSRQKGINIPANSSGTVPNVSVNLWTNNWAFPPDTPASSAAITFFDYDMVRDPLTGLPRSTLAYINRNLGTPQGLPNLGDPAEGPFPWLAHLDRPLMSPLELLMVPAWSQGRLTQEFQPMGQPGTPRNFDPYKEVDPNTGMPNPNFASPFTQLLNFFHTGNPIATPKISPQLTRLLDYVEVPCPFSGSEKWFNPGNTNQHFGDPAAGTTVASMYRPPFNKLSRFADPGKININTIYDDWALQAALGSLPYPGNAAQNQVFRQKVILSRQGYVDTTNPQPALAMDYRYPTRFANPFRPADSTDLMPAIADMRRLAPAEGTLLRSDYINTSPQSGPAPTPTPSGTPLFDAANATSVPPAQIYNYNDPNRNAYFEYQAYQKIGNVFSTQSNVYAVWITVGYFEVEENRPAAGGPIQIDIGHPDGYRLGQEVGADSGNTVRHRSFAIIDRSVPAAYEPGKRHNTDKMILLRRFIE